MLHWIQILIAMWPCNSNRNAPFYWKSISSLQLPLFLSRPHASVLRFAGVSISTRCPCIPHGVLRMRVNGGQTTEIYANIKKILKKIKLPYSQIKCTFKAQYFTSILLIYQNVWSWLKIWLFQDRKMRMRSKKKLVCTCLIDPCTCFYLMVNSKKGRRAWLRLTIKGKNLYLA